MPYICKQLLLEQELALLKAVCLTSHMESSMAEAKILALGLCFQSASPEWHGSGRQNGG